MSKDRMATFLADRLCKNYPILRRRIALNELERILSGAVNDWFGYKAYKQRDLSKSRREAASLGEKKFVNEQIALMADLMTGMWRLRQKLQNPGGDISPEAADVQSNFERLIWEPLLEVGYRAEEIPEKLVDSPHLKIVGYEFTPQQGEDRVVEMVKPILLYKNNCIQVGEVIIATAIQKEIRK
jgi:hypothetical protein